MLIGGDFSQAGGMNDRFYFVRFSSSGVFDPSFPAAAIEPQPGALMVAPDGSIYLSNNGTGMMLKLDANGTPDGSFGSVVTDGEIYSFALQPNGKILIAGTFANVGGAPHHALARLNADGSLDASFADVHLSFDATNPNGFAYGVAAQADGEAVVIGNFTFAESAPRQYMARVATGDYATSALVVQPNGASVDVTWYRLGDGPELGAAPTLTAFDRWRDLQRGWPDDARREWLACERAVRRARRALLSRSGRNDGRRRAGCVAGTDHERHLLERYDFRRRLRVTPTRPRCVSRPRAPSARAKARAGGRGAAR